MLGQNLDKVPLQAYLNNNKYLKQLVMKTNKLSIRLTDNQMLVLNELKDKLKCSYSTMIRSIVLNFLTVYEDQLEEIITGKRLIDLDEITYLNEE